MSFEIICENTSTLAPEYGIWLLFLPNDGMNDNFILTLHVITWLINLKNDMTVWDILAKNDLKIRIEFHLLLINNWANIMSGEPRTVAISNRESSIHRILSRYTQCWLHLLRSIFVFSDFLIKIRVIKMPVTGHSENLMSLASTIYIPIMFFSFRASFTVKRVFP